MTRRMGDGRGQAEMAADPVAAYLDSLTSETRRRQVVQQLDAAAAMLEAGSDRCTYPWPDLTPDSLRSLADLLSARFQPATTDRYLQAVLGVVRCSVERGLMPPQVGAALNEAASAYRRRAPEPKLASPLTDAQVAALSLAGDDSPHACRDRIFVALVYGCALRQAEALRLTWDRWDKGAGVLIVDGGPCPRSVPTPDGFADVLAAWAVHTGCRQGPLLRGLGPDGKPKGRVEPRFLSLREMLAADPGVRATPQPSGTGALTASGVQGLLASLSKRSGVPHLTCQRLRDAGLRAMLRIWTLGEVRYVAGLASLDPLLPLVEPVTTVVPGVRLPLVPKVQATTSSEDSHEVAATARAEAMSVQQDLAREQSHQRPRSDHQIRIARG